MALLYVTSAGWGTALRRLPEAMVALIPAGMLGIFMVFAGQPSLYPWTADHANANHSASAFTATWLKWPFFLLRAGVYFGLWYLLANALVRNSRRQDIVGDLDLTQRNVRLSALFLVVFSVTFWLASDDWIMSLDQGWSSTIFGAYNFAGMFQAGLAAVIVLAVWLHRLGPFRHVLTEEHRHDLGKLLFAFSTFWAYIWFCQYMLIWYVNNPEETSYYIRRLEGAWQPLVFVNVILNWVVPFVVLLPRATKCNPGVLSRVALVVLLGRGLDLALMVLPTLPEQEPLFWALDLVLLFGAAGVACLVIFSALRKAPLFPRNDPYLVESVPHGSNFDTQF